MSALLYRTIGEEESRCKGSDDKNRTDSSDASFNCDRILLPIGDYSSGSGDYFGCFFCSEE